MAEFEHSLDQDTLTIFLTGRITADNATDVETQINKIINENNHSSLVFNLAKLDYISSAGLRVVLRIKKVEPTLKLVDVSLDVYDVFEMTGFTEMMDIEKAYQEMSVDGCELIGQGSNGKVYRLNADTIIKVYMNKDALPDIQRERQLARSAFVLGIPTAIPYNVVKVGDTYGSVFELLNATSYVKLITEDRANIDKYINLSIDLLKKIHATQVKPEEMPDLKQVAVGWVEYLKEYLPEDKYNKLYKLVSDVPDTLNMIHGDYHMKNIMMQNGETLLIDMDTLSHGYPIFEFAAMYNAYEGFAYFNHDECMRFMGLDYDTCNYIWHKSLELYFDTTDKEKLEAIEKKAKLIGYTRIMRRTIKRVGFNEAKDVIEKYKELIINLLDEVDTLSL